MTRPAKESLSGRIAGPSSPKSKITDILARYPANHGSLIAILQDIQEMFGYLSEEAVEELERLMGISANEIHGVATFYTQFRFSPPGRHTIRSCQGTACHVRGGHQLLQELQQHLGIKAGQTTEDGEFDLERVACLGCCALAPVVSVNGKVHAKITAKKIPSILSQYAGRAPLEARKESVRQPDGKVLTGRGGRREQMTSLQPHVGRGLRQAFTEAQAQWRKLEESEIPIFFVGAATCGRAAGAEEVLQRLRSHIEAKKLDALVIEVGCLGPCSFEPLVIVHKSGAPRICYGNVGPDEIIHILENHVLGDDPCSQWALGKMTPGQLDGVNGFDAHPMMRRQVRNILRNCGLIDPENPYHYLACDGYRGFLKALEMGPDRTLEEVKAAGLRGRGGAGFPTWRKWQSCRDAPGRTKYLICNADEGDPGAFMNRSLIEGDPHAVLEGMLIAAFTLGASQGYIYCRAEYPLAIHRLQLAISQMRDLGLLGENIQDSGFSFELTIKKGAGAFVCGEETALIASIEGRRGMPQPRPPFPAESGLWGKPTVIQNVETLGNLPMILRNGADWYAQYGSESSKGTKTFALAGKIERTGLIEVPLGITLKDIIYDIGGGIPAGKALKAVQTGGPSGGCIPAEKMDLPVDYESLTEAGSIMGSGGMIVLDEDTCVVDIAKFFLSFTQEESCGKCAPCRVGTRAMLSILERIAAGEGERADLDNLEKIAQTVKDGSLCGLGQTAPNPVLTTLRYFREEYEEHIDKGRCPAFVCSRIVSYHIDPDRCSGCGACARVCPVEAISGEKKKTHTIDQEICIRCGACLSTCPPIYAAVYRRSGELTRYEQRKEK